MRGPRGLDRAEKHLEAWLKLDPKSTAALQRLAQCLFQQKKVDEALAKLKEAAKIEPDRLTPEALVGQWFWARTGDQKERHQVDDCRDQRGAEGRQNPAGRLPMGLGDGTI